MKVSEDEDSELQGCYEQMSCSDLQKVIAIFAKLSAWFEECIRNNCSAGELLTPTRSSRDCTRLESSNAKDTNYSVIIGVLHAWPKRVVIV